MQHRAVGIETCSHGDTLTNTFNPVGKGAKAIAKQISTATLTSVAGAGG